MTNARLFSDLFGAGSIRRVGRDVLPHFSDHETEVTATLVRADGSEVYVFHPEYRLFFCPRQGIIKGVGRLVLRDGRPSAAVRGRTEIVPGCRYVLSVLKGLEECVCHLLGPTYGVGCGMEGCYRNLDLDAPEGGSCCGNLSEI